MPNGWSVVPSSKRVDTQSVGCFPNFLKPEGFKRLSYARAIFEDNGGLSYVSEEIAIYSKSSKEAFAKIVGTLKACPKFDGVGGGQAVKGTVHEMPFTKYGSESAAFKLTLTHARDTAFEDLLIVRQGKYIMAISHVDLTPEAGQFQTFVELATSKFERAR
jgi:hypothetical protein